ncbi:DUF4435 domain-containing protein [Sphingobacteriaceae bacterium WQ 2009]|uniref:DUF4435 domain-containing protein n=1 Tax=Rhinopithecimicrobium faecis TaxID=2820698 RepID=A0A8T4HBR6_9SPHI|nr:DUF4435 domain-containing protein [Sphingobacteriaceae bacterium WQ 2009]
MLKFSNESRKISSSFKAYRNDVSIFTEDEEKDKEFYTLLLKRVLGDSVKINDITPLGCKQNVLKYCFESSVSKKEVYIIDGDIQTIKGDHSVSHPKLFILDRYCIENYLMDENSVIKYIYNHTGTYSEEKIKEDLNFEEWLLQFSEPFTKLFIHFAISDHFHIGYTLFNARKYFNVKKDSISFDSALVDQDIEIIKNIIIENHGIDAYTDIVDFFENKWQPNIETLLKIVSGKNYLIPLLQIKANEFKKNKNIETLESCKICLVQNFDVINLDNLKTFIEKIA